MRCRQCDSDMQEGAEVCPNCGMGAADPEALAPMAAAAPQSIFDPGPSFHEQPADAAAGELPGWLQNFAGAVAEPELPALTPAPAAATTALADSAELPSWLTEPRVGATAAAPVGWDGMNAQLEPQGDGFISEDDLPEWLRAISLDPVSEDSASSPLPASSAPAAAPAVAALRAPAVASAWVTPRQSVALAASESLFADIAGEEPRQAPQASEPGATPSLALSPAANDVVVGSTAAELTPAATPTPFARRYLLYLLVAVALLVLIFMVKG